MTLKESSTNFKSEVSKFILKCLQWQEVVICSIAIGPLRKSTNRQKKNCEKTYCQDKKKNLKLYFSIDSMG